MSGVDLHLHTSISDGRYTPGEIVRKSIASGVSILAISDHDSVDGVSEALETARTIPGMKVIPAVEISTYLEQGEAHVLGYFVDYTNEDLLNNLESLRESRITRARDMITRLASLGVHIKWERVRELATGSSVGRPHIAQAMLEKDYIHSIKEAFVKYIGKGGPAYVERAKLSPSEAVQLVTRTGGLPVLAHPFTVNSVESMISALLEVGMVGLEAYYDSYTAEQKDALVGLARKYDLIATGGSDYHGLDEDAETAIGGSAVPRESAELLIAMAKQRHLREA